MDDNMSDLEKKILCNYSLNNTSLPLKISNNGVITLDYKLVREENMQVPGNDFEGWAIAARICSESDVKLDVKGIENFPNDGYVGHGHLNRFLYRAMKFNEQYEWFGLSDELNSRVEAFYNYLNDKSRVFVNNVPTKEAGNTYKIYDENAVEDKMSKDGVLKNILKNVGDGKVYRQLPVGLFEKEKAKANAIFTYGKSAIDLWNINDDTINLIELKTKNPMLGIITEIFFYSNYIYDFITGKNGFNLIEVPKVSKESYLRGYNELYKAKKKICRVCGIMLADDEEKFHQIVNTDCLSILNDNRNSNMKYDMKLYHCTINVDLTCTNSDLSI